MEEEFEPEVAVSDIPEVKLFGKWTTSDVQINDISLTVMLLVLNSQIVINDCHVKKEIFHIMSKLLFLISIKKNSTVLNFQLYCCFLVTSFKTIPPD